MAEGSNPLVRGERRCAVGVDEHGNIFAQYVRADWADAEIGRLTAQRSEAMREITRMQSEIERLNRFADFLCRQDWTSRGRVIAEEAFMNAIAMDKEAGFPQPESRDG